MRGIDEVRKGQDINLFEHLCDLASQAVDGSLIFANLVEFDSLYGHRRDVSGYARHLEWFDAALPRLLDLLRPDDLLLITAAALGLGAILATSAFWFSVVKWVGVVYLAWLGIQMLRSKADIGDASKFATTGQGAGVPMRLFRKSFLVAATNPKGYIFFAAFLPQFVDLGEPLFSQYAMLALIFVAIDLAVMTAYAAVGVNAMRFLREKGAMWLERGCGIAMLTLAGGLAFYKRA